MSFRSSQLPSCSVVIATLDRVSTLLKVLDCLERQTVRPDEVILCVAGDAGALRQSLAERSSTLPVRVLQSSVKSSARQRNQGAEKAIGDVLAFLDDDIEFESDLFERLLEHFTDLSPRQMGGLSPRIANQGRNRPGRLTLAYYRLQAGYSHADYGGCLFGPAINCFPIFEDDGPELVPVEWLPSTCLFLWAEHFRRHRFPEFDGYSFAEDVHLTARIAREVPIHFLREPSILHHSQSSEFKRDAASLAAGKLHNMAVIAREVMHDPNFHWKWELHRIFMMINLLLRRPAQWRDELRGVWRAKA
jgi:glycosyltransferase involved in cell wall biosynthesis